MANPTQREGPSSASLKEPVARNFADPAKAVYLDGPGCLAFLQCLFWKHVAVQMLPFLQATKRTAPPPALESNTWPTYNFHLRFFQVHHYQKNQLPFSRVTVQRVRLRREGKQCRSCLRAQWANPSDAEPPVAFAEAGEAGERMKHHESQLDAKQTTNTVVGKTIWQTTNTVVGDCFFQTWKGCGEWVMIVMALWRLGPPEIKVKLHVLKTCFVGVLLIGPPRRHLLFVLFATHNSAGCASDYSGERWSGVARGAGQESLEHRRGWRCE